MPATELSRRRLITAAALGAGTVLAGTGAPAIARRAGGTAGPSGLARGAVQLNLPRPTGPWPVGTVALHLVDPARCDPWEPQARRELMVNLWYPTRRRAGHPVAPWLSPAAAERFLADEPELAQLGIRLPWTHGQVSTAVRQRHGGLPVVLYSPGYGGARSGNTLVVEELASYGYLVVTIDHTHETAVVEFPDGRLKTNAFALDRDHLPAALAVRVADTRFVLDQLRVLNAGGNPDATGHPLPAGLSGCARLDRVAMFGHSLGGATAAAAMLEDGRLRAAANLDGDLYDAVVKKGLDRPFLHLSHPGNTRCEEPSLATAWPRLRGWRRGLMLHKSEHLTFGDLVVLYPQLVAAAYREPDLQQALRQQMVDAVGTIKTHRAVAATRAYVLAFFDLHLRGRGHLLDGPSPAYPEMDFIPDAGPCPETGTRRTAT